MFTSLRLMTGGLTFPIVHLMNDKYGYKPNATSKIEPKKDKLIIPKRVPYNYADSQKDITAFSVETKNNA